VKFAELNSDSADSGGRPCLCDQSVSHWMMENARRTYLTRSASVNGCRGFEASSEIWSSVTVTVLSFIVRLDARVGCDIGRHGLDARRHRDLRITGLCSAVIALSTLVCGSISVNDESRGLDADCPEEASSTIDAGGPFLLPRPRTGWF